MTSDAPLLSESKKKTILAIAIFTIFLDLLGFGLLIPLQPFYAEFYGASPTQVTILGASFSAMQFLFAPFWGRLSDRIGRRPVVLLSVAITCFGYLLFGFAASLGVLFAARLLSGFGSANLGTIQAIVADSTSLENRAKGMGLIGAAFGLGFILGPAVGGFLVHFGKEVPIFFAAGLTALNFLFALFFLPETYRPGKDSKKYGLISFQALKQAAAFPNILPIFLLYFLLTSGFSLMEQILGLFLEKTWLPAISHSALTLAQKEARFREAASLNASVLVCIGSAALVVQGVFLSRLVRRFGEKGLLFGGTLLLTTAVLCVPLVGLTKIFPLLMLNAGVIAIATSLNNPSLSSLLSRSTPPDLQGSLLGQAQSFAALGRVLGPAVAGFFFELHFLIPFFVSASIILFAHVVTYRLRPPQSFSPP